MIIPVVITIYQRSVLYLHHQDAAGAGAAQARGEHSEGVGEPNKTKVGKMTEKQVEEIAKIKMPDLNCFDVAAAVRSVKGTARSMGVDVVVARRTTDPVQ